MSIITLNENIDDNDNDYNIAINIRNPIKIIQSDISSDNIDKQ